MPPGRKPCEMYTSDGIREESILFRSGYLTVSTLTLMAKS